MTVSMEGFEADGSRVRYSFDQVCLDGGRAPEDAGMSSSTGDSDRSRDSSGRVRVGSIERCAPDDVVAVSRSVARR
jgi:hypothetical protein